MQITQRAIHGNFKECTILEKMLNQINVFKVGLNWFRVLNLECIWSKVQEIIIYEWFSWVSFQDMTSNVNWHAEPFK